MEDNVLAGGFGSAILESFDSLGINLPIKRIGWPDQFIEHGSSVNSLRKRYALDFNNIFNDVNYFLGQLGIKQKSLVV